MIYQRNPEIKWQIIDEKVVLVDASEGDLVHFNAIGTEVWQRLSGKNTLDEILAELSGQWDIPFKTLEKDVTKFVKDLSKMELIQKAQAS